MDDLVMMLLLSIVELLFEGTQLRKIPYSSLSGVRTKRKDPVGRIVLLCSVRITEQLFLMIEDGRS